MVAGTVKDAAARFDVVAALLSASAALCIIALMRFFELIAATSQFALYGFVKMTLD